MSSFFWNIRGLNKSSKNSIIRSWINNSNMQFGCLLETRVKEGKASKLISSIFKGWSVCSNYEYGRLGRIWVLWKDNVHLTLVFKSAPLVTCSVLLEGKDEEFFSSFVYASNFSEERRELWSDLRDHYESPIFRKKPWMICGDFNEILAGEEHSNHDHSPTVTRGMRDFQSLVMHCSMQDLAYNGPLYTWCNKRDVGLVCKKLDRVLVNEEWTEKFTQSYSVFEAGGCSDHLRGRVVIECDHRQIRRPFKFSNVLTTIPEFIPAIENAWEKTRPLFISTSALFHFTKKLKDLKPELRSFG